jgi:tetratricopeptide (TPR) repeat protein
MSCGAAASPTGTEAPPPKPKKKRGKLAAILAIVLAAVILGAAAYFFVIPKFFSPDEPKEPEYTEAEKQEAIVSALVARGDAHFELEEYEDAASDYEEAIREAEEGDAKVYGKLADCYTALGETEKAVKALEDGVAATGDKKLAKRLEELAVTPEPVEAAAPDETEPPLVMPQSREIGYFDPNYDYTLGERYRVAYLSLFGDGYYVSAYERWAEQMNMEFTSTSVDFGSDLWLYLIEDYASQGYDGLIIDAYEDVYAIAAERCAELGIPWMPGLASPASMHPSFSYDNYAVGRQTAEKLIEYRNTNWPDVPWEQIALYSINLDGVISFNDFQRGVSDVYSEKVGLADNYLVSMDETYDFSADGALSLTLAAVSENGQYTHWLVAAPFDAYAEGAVNALEVLGLTDSACVASVGGAGAQLRWDAGQSGAWRYALYMSDTLSAEPTLGALYAFMSEQATPETLWPQWVNRSSGDRYASLIAPSFWLDETNYQRYLAWTDVYSGTNNFPTYSRVGLARDSYPARAAVPDGYR